MANPAAIEIKDIGPVEEFSYTMEKPGLHVLDGPSGAGKSTTLRTVELASTGATAVKPTKRRGAKKGQAVVGGRKVSINSMTRTSGELGFDGLGDLDITVIHWPNVGTRAGRDAKRVQALVRASGVEASPELFTGLEGFADAVVVADLPKDDLVNMAGAVKRQFEKCSRTHEAELEKLERLKATCDRECEGVDLEAETDVAVLSQRQADAVQAQTDLGRRITEFGEAKTKAERGEKWLAENEAPELSADECRAKRESLATALKAVSADIEALEKREGELELEISGLEADELRASSYFGDAEECQDAVDRFAELTEPSVVDAEKAAQAVTEAGEALVVAQRVAVAQRAKEDAEGYVPEIARVKKLAETLRESAQAVAGRLSDAVNSIPGCPIKTEFDDNGEVLLTVDGGIPFDEKSDGERWRLVVPMCFAPNRIIVIPQAAFGEISDEACDFLHQSAIDNDCFILTARVTDSGVEMAGHPWGE